ncbi:uncharacterized protein LOC130927526 [Corythoichthys intestinalis]|uniref:uncharacterized protein LOC130927526 n=1 Tax=Corythoichthys intestinalis TaxID=161448 RepID=UPI0025A67536|nr:uncharacterized protein LOC130927526 [Corythoichthys intestinalis]
MDYYIWKSHDALLRLSNSGSLLGNEESTIPKTYSTRRGPLLLYSRDLVTIGTECQSQDLDRKRRVTQQYKQKAGHRSDTLILHQRHEQFNRQFATPSLHPHPNAQYASVSRLHVIRGKHPELPGDHWETSSHLKDPPEGENEMQGSDRKVCLDLVLQIPRVSSSHSQNSKDPTTFEEPQELQVNLSRAGSSQTCKSSDVTLALSAEEIPIDYQRSGNIVNPQTSGNWTNNSLVLPPLRARHAVTSESSCQKTIIVSLC